MFNPWDLLSAFLIGAIVGGAALWLAMIPKVQRREQADAARIAKAEAVVKASLKTVLRFVRSREEMRARMVAAMRRTRTAEAQAAVMFQAERVRRALEMPDPVVIPTDSPLYRTFKARLDAGELKLTDDLNKQH